MPQKEENTNPTQNSVTASQTTANPEAVEAQALTELKKRVEELSAENANLQQAKHDYYDAVLNGQKPSAPAEEKHRSIQEIRDDLVRGVENGISNLDYCRLILELDNENRRVNKESCFLPKGHNVGQISQDEYASADHLNDVLTDCIEKANGDPNAFNVYLARRIRQ